MMQAGRIINVVCIIAGSLALLTGVVLPERVVEKLVETTFIDALSRWVPFITVAAHGFPEYSRAVLTLSVQSVFLPLYLLAFICFVPPWSPELKKKSRDLIHSHSALEAAGYLMIGTVVSIFIVLNDSGILNSCSLIGGDLLAVSDNVYSEPAMLRLPHANVFAMMLISFIYPLGVASVYYVIISFYSSTFAIYAKRIFRRAS